MWITVYIFGNIVLGKLYNFENDWRSSKANLKDLSETGHHLDMTWNIYVTCFNNVMPWPKQALRTSLTQLCLSRIVLLFPCHTIWWLQYRFKISFTFSYSLTIVCPHHMFIISLQRTINEIIYSVSNTLDVSVFSSQSSKVVLLNKY